ncbi:MAG: hypothetical protein HOC27_00930 [Phycisphaerae bacterium]|nr:hypothetical protein [Phycisphaerae bacterium]
MKQKIINMVLVLIILIVGLCIVGILVLDGVAQSIIQSKGSEGLGVEVKLASVHIGFFGSDTKASEIAIANPKEFHTDTSPDLLTIKEVHVDFNIFQMAHKEVIIPNASCEGVVLVLQQNGGKSNIEIMVDNIAADTTPEATHPKPPFNIEKLTIKDITVIASGNFTVLNTKPVTAHIDEIVLKNIGTDGDVEVATEAITTAVTHAIMKHLEQNPVEGLSKIAFSNVTGAINEIPVFKELGIGTGIQNVTNGIGAGVDGILGGIGDLLGGGKKDKPD